AVAGAAVELEGARGVARDAAASFVEAAERDAPVQGTVAAGGLVELARAGERSVEALGEPAHRGARRGVAAVAGVLEELGGAQASSLRSSRSPSRRQPVASPFLQAPR